MSRLERIPGISNDEITALRPPPNVQNRPRYEDQEALQKVLDKGERGIDTVAAAAHLPVKRVAELLAASLHQSASPLTRGWLASHWADLLLIAGITVLAMLALLGTWADARKKADQDVQNAEARAQPRVVASHPLPAYVSLTVGDLLIQNANSPEQANKLIAPIIGHYALQPINKSEGVDLANISSGKATLSEFSVVALKLKLKPAAVARSFPVAANLLFSPNAEHSPGAVFPIQLLNLESDGLTATVAIPTAQLTAAAAWIGNSDAYIVFPAR